MTIEASETTIASILARVSNVEQGLAARSTASAQSALNYRRDAMSYAIASIGKHARPETTVAAAATFESYLRDGVPPPRPGHPSELPSDLVEIARRVPASTLYVVQRVLAERLRQIGNGFDAEHDDTHHDGQMAREAASAIVTDDTRFVGAPIYGWVYSGQPRHLELIKGIALAVAELERLGRVNQDGSPPEEVDALVAAGRMSDDEGRKAMGLEPIPPADGD